MERVKSPSLIECSINRLLSLEPASPPAHSTSQQLWSNSLDFDLDSLGGLSKGNNQSSNLSVRKPLLPKKQLPPLQKASSTLTASTAAPADHKKHHHVQEPVQMHPIPVKSVPLLLEPDDNPKLVHRDTMVASRFFDSAPMESLNERDFHSSKLSLATIGLITGESQPDPIRPGYIFKPVQGKQFSKTVRLSSPMARSTDKFSMKQSLSTMSLSPVHRQELEEGSMSLKLDNLDGSVSDGLLSRGSLQIGLPEEVSRLPSPNLQVPMLPIHTHFDDEGFLSSEFQSEREPLPAEQFPPNSLDNPFSLDISEKPMDEGNIVDMEKVSPDAGPATREKTNRLTESRNTRLMRGIHTTTPGDLQTASTVSTLGDANVVPYAVHRRILGWKLTSVEKRRELVDIMDAVHGNASPDLQVRLRKSKLLRGRDSTADAQLTAFGGSQSLPNLRSTMAASRSQLDPFMLRAKTRQTIAYEDFVTRSVNSRQGFRSVQQIKNFVEDQKKKKDERDRIISGQKQQQQRQSVSPLHLDFDFAGPDPIADPQSRSLTVRPYIPVGTLTSADKFGKSTDTVTLKSLLAEALFAEGELTADEDAEAAKQFATANMSAAERLYNYPVGVHRPRSRMDILDSVRIRQELEPAMSGGASWKEDQLVDAFIAGRQNARMRRSRDQSRELGESRSKVSLKTDLLGDNWDDESILSLSTSAEENEQALSEALMENFGLSLHDDDLGHMESDFEPYPGLAQGSALESEAGTSHFAPPSLHPPQPLSAVSSLADDSHSWVSDNR